MGPVNRDPQSQTRRVDQRPNSFGGFSVAVRTISPLFSVISAPHVHISDVKPEERKWYLIDSCFEECNQHPAEESPTLKAQEECLEDCELSSSTVNSTHSTKVSTIGTRRKAGGTCPVLSAYSMLLASPPWHVNSTPVTWW